MREHELRRQVVSEMHLRRWPQLHVPGKVIQWVLMTDREDREAELAHLDPILPAPADKPNAPHRSGDFSPGIAVAWERHSEGSSLALFAKGTDPDLADALEWARGLPGQIVRATNMTLVKDDRAAKRLLPKMNFDPHEIVSCYIGGKARIWADFRLQGDGFGHILVAANGLDDRDFSRTVQRLQDLGNYRNKALLGLPEAQEHWPRLDAIETELAKLADRLCANNGRDDDLMAELSSLSLELTTVATMTGYRMSATRAYAQLVQERLEELQVKPIDGFASLNTFTKRRFLPAARFCEALVVREEQLSQRAERLASLLRARIDTRIENQNAELMRSMDRSSKLQLRLQQLVEGLSVVALSYYLLGLVTWGLEGWDGVDATDTVALLVVPTVLTMFIGVRIAKRRLLGSGED
ncbi:DUF3422 domain-containing protein [Aurantiacibacter sediminis]|uniref:DUF3422 domain-containing protein n=1 Tax=Aurantiacibacter sediminis TaxID=2793064 RepID=A0ABS0N5Z0_9SPHN|nr:DUF3422 domain-containing protein [Aurantiacibacter sediminis]MBH5323220.1 DUF3422 domain-containing protein [Aurantiacibacter sediminis]